MAWVQSLAGPKNTHTHTHTHTHTYIHTHTHTHTHLPLTGAWFVIYWSILLFSDDFALQNKKEWTSFQLIASQFQIHPRDPETSPSPSDMTFISVHTDCRRDPGGGRVSPPGSGVLSFSCSSCTGLEVRKARETHP